MIRSHAIGIDLGTTYSCIARLNEHGEPVTIANQEGELSTPSVVFFDGDDVVVGTEALRNAIVHPDLVVQNAKRYVGTAKTWQIRNRFYTARDIQAIILKKLLAAAEEQIGEKIARAVITVPAQFSDFQRRETVAAGKQAGLEHVDIINEPVAAALCHVLGTEGLWFTELAEAQRILVYDLGGGTFDLSMVKYEKNEVSVVASGGDLRLGGIDWNNALEKAIAGQFASEFGADPRSEPDSRQFLANEVEGAKRSLSVRPKAALTCQFGSHRKTYQVRQEQFEQLTAGLTDRTEEITQAMLKSNKMGWAHVDVILTTGGASRMPMVRNMLKRIGGRTLNTSLSPDQSIAHGATYYGGMLMTDREFATSILNQEAAVRLSQIRQISVNARELGILVRDVEKDERVPHYLIEANTPLPTTVTKNFGTVIPNQKRVSLRIVESGAGTKEPYVELGTCVIDELPEDLPEGSEIAVSISYDAEARVHVAARDVVSGRQANAEIVRKENLVGGAGVDASSDVALKEPTRKPRPPAAPPASRQAEAPPVAAKPPPRKTTTRSERDRRLDSSEQPVPLCNRCGEPLDHNGTCPECGGEPRSRRKAAAEQPRKEPARPGTPTRRQKSDVSDDDILEFLDDGTAAPRKKQTRRKKQGPPRKKKTKQPREKIVGEDEFWDLDI